MTSAPAGDAERLSVIRHDHIALEQQFAARAAALDRRGFRLSMFRLVAFLAAVVAIRPAYLDRDAATLGALLLAACGFIVALLWHARVLRAKEHAEICSAIHRRHAMRTTRDWTTLPVPREPCADDHPYAWDIDLVGEGSLMQRMDVSHTVWGERTLLDWLCRPSSRDRIVERQLAVRELCELADFRRELEACALGAGLDRKLSGERFLDFVQEPPLVVGPLAVAARALPVVNAALFGLVVAGYLPPAWILGLVPQFLVVFWKWRAVSRVFALLDTRRRHLELFSGVFRLVERQQFRASRLKSLRSRFDAQGKAPSRHLRALAGWAGWADLRFQGMVHPFINLLFMWDLQILQRMEHWNRVAGSHVRSWFEAIGEFEALSSLATLKALEPGSGFPDIVESNRGISAIDLGHPLLPIEQRVNNPLVLRAPGAFWIVTGSNMAGKSTWLRAVGLNAALALAGGAVCARQFVLPIVRVRSSMRVRDSLQAGASYFYAEVLKLKSLVAGAGVAPPILFLCDELLRGTNAHDRTLGARAIVTHLVTRHAMGIVATHDDALCDICDEPGFSGQNVHFTDVLVNGEMTFDFKLRPGRATDGNALAVLAQAGISVPELLSPAMSVGVGDRGAPDEASCVAMVESR